MMAEAAAGVATATEFEVPTLDFGYMASTALGAVNTGAITSGVNADVQGIAGISEMALSGL